MDVVTYQVTYASKGGPLVLTGDNYNSSSVRYIVINKIYRNVASVFMWVIKAIIQICRRRFVAMT